MEPNSKSLRRGVGTIKAIADELANLPECELEHQTTIRAISEMLSAAVADETTYHYVKQLVCGVLNVEFRNSGKLWYVSNSHVVTSEYITSGTPRELMAELAGL